MQRKLSIAAGAALALTFLWTMIDGRAERRDADRKLAELEARLESLGGGAPGPASSSSLSSSSSSSSEELAALARREARAAAQEELARDGGERANDRGAPPRLAVSLEQSQKNVLGAFAQEAADADWSSDASHQLESILRGRLPKGSRLGSIDCRATMCQVEIAHADERAAQAFLLDGFGDWPGSRFVAAQRQEAGEQVVTIIASRQGHEPPIAAR